MNFYLWIYIEAYKNEPKIEAHGTLDGTNKGHKITL